MTPSHGSFNDAALPVGQTVHRSGRRPDVHRAVDQQLGRDDRRELRERRQRRSDLHGRQRVHRAGAHGRYVMLRDAGADRRRGRDRGRWPRRLDRHRRRGRPRRHHGHARARAAAAGPRAGAGAAGSTGAAGRRGTGSAGATGAAGATMPAGAGGSTGTGGDADVPMDRGVSGGCACDTAGSGSARAWRARCCWRWDSPSPSRGRARAPRRGARAPTRLADDVRRRYGRSPMSTIAQAWIGSSPSAVARVDQRVALRAGIQEQLGRGPFALIASSSVMPTDGGTYIDTRSTGPGTSVTVA